MHEPAQQPIYSGLALKKASALSEKMKAWVSPKLSQVWTETHDGHVGVLKPPTMRPFADLATINVFGVVSTASCQAEALHLFPIEA